MLYRLARLVAIIALRLFYRLEVRRPARLPAGPLIVVGNHPNAMMDPALVMVAVPRRLSFLGKATLFQVPVLGWFFRSLGAVPVYRRQDDPAQTGRNEETFDACHTALLGGGAVTLFPEGKSHSEPALAELRTGCARIALRASAAGQRLHLVPVGITYARRHRFRSRVLVEVGAPLEVREGQPGTPAEVRGLTDRIAEALRALTLNLAQHEDLPLLRTAEALYALRRHEQPKDLDRLRRFSRGLELLRAEQPERLEALRHELEAFQRRLDLVGVDPTDLEAPSSRRVAVAFAGQLAAFVLGLPLAALGFAFFLVPFFAPRVAVALVRPKPNYVATVKLLTSLFFLPCWVGAWAYVAARSFGPWAAVAVVALSVPLGLFTRIWLERRAHAVEDLRALWLLGNRRGLRERLTHSGERLAAELEALAAEVRPRVNPEAASASR